MILRALRGAEVDPDISIREARQGARYLLCSDGLSDVVSTETIIETLRVPDPQEAADRLVELALRGGGPDNVTVIVADVVEARVGDSVDDVPVIAGAFVDPTAADVPGTDSPAERAAHIARRPGPVPAPVVAPRGRRRWRMWAVAAAAVALVIAGLTGAYAWTQTYYFVGKDGSEVAIFRGVNTSFGPLKFYEVSENTSLALDDLDQSARAQVMSGITAKNKDDARQIVQRLTTDHLLPPCPTPTPTVSVTPVPSASTSHSTHPPSVHASATRAPTATRSTPKPPPPATPTPSASPSPTLIPHVDCRP